MITKTICISGFDKKIEPIKLQITGYIGDLFNNDKIIEKKINNIIEQQNRIIDYLNKEVNK